MGWGDDSVLPGPKFPFWGCSQCGNSGNWASRIKCKCGATAPTRIVQAAKREAAALKSQPAHGGAPRARGMWAKGPPQPPVVKKLEERLKLLEAENKKLRESPKEDDTNEAGNGAEGSDENTDIGELISALAKLEKARASHQLVAAARAELETARRKRDEARPTRHKISAAQKKLGTKKNVLEASEAKILELREAAKKAEEAVNEETRLRDGLAREVAQLEKDLSQLRQEELLAESKVELPKSENILGALDPREVESATSTEERELLQRAESIMARVRQQRASEAASVHEQLAPTQLDAPATAATTAAPTAAAAASAAERRVVDSAPMQLEDVGELERQAIISERQAEHARERVENAKKARVA